MLLQGRVRSDSLEPAGGDSTVATDALLVEIDALKLKFLESEAACKGLLQMKQEAEEQYEQTTKRFTRSPGALTAPSPQYPHYPVYPWLHPVSSVPLTTGIGGFLLHSCARRAGEHQPRPQPRCRPLVGLSCQSTALVLSGLVCLVFHVHFCTRVPAL